MNNVDIVLPLFATPNQQFSHRSTTLTYQVSVSAFLFWFSYIRTFPYNIAYVFTFYYFIKTLYDVYNVS